MQNAIVDVEGHSISITTTWNSHRVAFLGEPESKQSAVVSPQTVHRMRPRTGDAGADYEVRVFRSSTVAWIVRRGGQVLSSKRPAVSLGWVFVIIGAFRSAEYFMTRDRSDLGIAALYAVVGVFVFAPYVLWKRQMK